MGSDDKARYVDAEKLKIEILGIYPGVPSNYSSSQIEQQINQLVGMAMVNAFESFKTQLAEAIYRASKPYDKCMLCVQRDACIPEHPLGDNR